MYVRCIVIRCFYCCPALRHWLPTSVPLSSVCCPSCGYISKTKQDSLIVTMEHYQEGGIADCVAAFRSFPDAPRGDRYSGFILYVEKCVHMRVVR